MLEQKYFVSQFPPAFGGRRNDSIHIESVNSHDIASRRDELLCTLWRESLSLQGAAHFSHDICYLGMRQPVRCRCVQVVNETGVADAVTRQYGLQARLSPEQTQVREMSAGHSVSGGAKADDSGRYQNRHRRHGFAV